MQKLSHTYLLAGYLRDGAAAWKEKVNWKEALFWSLLSITMMGLIFWFSSQDGEHSTIQSNWIVSLLGYWLPKEHASFLVRKTAHFTIYLVLGICVQQAASALLVPKRAVILTAWLICTLYAGSDEIHQLLIDGRSGQITDILLDSCGSFVGVTLSWLILQSKSCKIF